MGPVAMSAGMVTVSDVGVAAVTTAGVPLSSTLSFTATLEKLLPPIVTDVPVRPPPGEKLAIVGALTDGFTVNEPVLLALNEPAVTLIVPEVAPLGTDTTSWEEVAEVTVAAVPLNRTELADGVVEKPEP